MDRPASTLFCGVLAPLYPILDVDLAAANGHDLVRCAAAFTGLGLELQQLRAKNMGAGEMVTLARRLRQVVPRLIVNDRLDVALLADCAGVHLGQDDLPPASVRPLLPPEGWIGYSTHSRAQALAAADVPGLPPAAPGYLALGPIFATTSKQRPDPVVGLEAIRAVRAEYRALLVGIGGITPANCTAVWQAGADTVAAIAALWCTPDPVVAAQAFLLAFQRFSCHSPRE